MSQTDLNELQPAPTSTELQDNRRGSTLGNALGVAACAIALGLLLWAKLQLVAGIPKTAVAVPEETTPVAEAPMAPASGPIAEAEQTGGRGDTSAAPNNPSDH